MLAQKQPFIQRVRNSSLVERSRAENDRGSNTSPKLRDAYASVGEHCHIREAVPEGAVEVWEERMPER